MKCLLSQITTLPSFSASLAETVEPVDIKLSDWRGRHGGHRSREVFHIPLSDNAEKTGGYLPDMTKTTPFGGGGLSSSWTPDYSHVLLTTNWSPTTHHGLIVTRTDEKLGGLSCSRTRT